MNGDGLRALRQRLRTHRSPAVRTLGDAGSKVYWGARRARLRAWRSTRRATRRATRATRRSGMAMTRRTVRAWQSSEVHARSHAAVLAVRRSRRYERLSRRSSRLVRAVVPPAADATVAAARANVSSAVFRLRLTSAGWTPLARLDRKVRPRVVDGRGVPCRDVVPLVEHLPAASVIVVVDDPDLAPVRAARLLYEYVPRVAASGVDRLRPVLLAYGASEVVRVIATDDGGYALADAGKGRHHAATG